jgi:eukaryotic-like serine/threonine-protein kinase
MKLCPRCSESYADDAGFCPIDGTGLVKNVDPLIGRTLASRYRLVKRLGSGGMALVYLARHVMIERLSAIKVLRQDLGMNPAHRERFLREARAVNRINHPGIVEITDFGESDGLVFLVMEYVEGESLLGALRKGVFPWQRAARVAMQVASALARAHELGVIHRDLKPENVLLIPRGDGRSPAAPEPGQNVNESVNEIVKLTDFGIAKILDAPKLTFTEQRLGTPGYIAPEYMDGSAAGPRGDLYGLGVVFYEMLTGTLPFDGKGVELLVAMVRDAPTPLGARVEGTPPEIEELVMRLIARDPDERPRDAFVVHDALGDMLRRLGGGPEQAPAEAGGSVAKVERESVPTMVDEEEEGRGVPRPPAEEAALPPLPALDSDEVVARWRAMIDKVSRQIAAASGVDGADGKRLAVRRAGELTEVAKELFASLGRARSKVADYQVVVDRLEAHGRSFRATLGHAIDTLSRDLSQEKAHLDAIVAHRKGVDRASVTRDLDARRKETLFWEEAALTTEEKRVRWVVADLSYQTTALQNQLDEQNEELDQDLTDATGKLEGALTAFRRMTGEFVRTIEDASAALTSS